MSIPLVTSTRGAVNAVVNLLLVNTSRAAKRRDHNDPDLRRRPKGFYIVKGKHIMWAKGTVQVRERYDAIK